MLNRKNLSKVILFIVLTLFVLHIIGINGQLYPFPNAPVPTPKPKVMNFTGVIKCADGHCHCPENPVTERYPDLDDLSCENYYLCHKGLAYHRWCGARRAFHPELRQCLPRSTILYRTCPNAIVCDMNGYVPDPRDCTMYYMCFYGQAYHYGCKSSHYYDAKKRRCISDKKRAVACQKNRKTKTQVKPFNYAAAPIEPPPKAPTHMQSPFKTMQRMKMNGIPLKQSQHFVQINPMQQQQTGQQLRFGNQNVMMTPNTQNLRMPETNQFAQMQQNPMMTPNAQNLNQFTQMQQQNAMMNPNAQDLNQFMQMQQNAMMNPNAQNLGMPETNQFAQMQQQQQISNINSPFTNNNGVVMNHQGQSGMTPQEFMPQNHIGSQMQTTGQIMTNPGTMGHHPMESNNMVPGNPMSMQNYGSVGVGSAMQDDTGGPGWQAGF